MITNNKLSLIRDKKDECNNSSELFENRITELVALNHHVFNEREAAFYCRCSVDSIRYHALRSRKLMFCDFTKDGLIFLKSDLDSFLEKTRRVPSSKEKKLCMN